MIQRLGGRCLSLLATALIFVIFWPTNQALGQSTDGLPRGGEAGAPAIHWVVPEPSSTPIRVSSPYSVTFYLLDERGGPILGATPEVSIEGGVPQGIREDIPGVYVLDCLPTGESIKATVLTPEGPRLLLEGPTLPALLPEIAISFGAEALHLARATEVEFTIDAGLPGLPEPSLLDLQVITNVGEVEGLESLGDGRFRGRYVAPTQKRPQVAILGVRIGGGETFRWGAASIPLVGRTTLETRTSPGATVLARVDGINYGPFQADDAGNVRVVVEVPPGVMGVELTSTNKGGTSTTTSPLGLPPYPQGLILLGEGQPYHRKGLGGEEDVLPPIERGIVFVGVDPRGEPLTPALGDIDLGAAKLFSPESPRLGALRGLISLSPHEAPLRVVFVPSEPEGALEIVAEIEADLGRPERLKLGVNPLSLRVDDPPAQLEIESFDGAGLPARGGQIVLEASEGSVSTPKVLGPGEFVAAYNPPSSLDGGGSAGAMMVDVRAKLFWDPGLGAPERIAVVPSQKMVNPDPGGGQVPIYVRLLDRSGLPVVDIPLNGRVLSGGGILTGSETDAGGWATLQYIPPDDGGVGPVKMRVLVEGYPRLYRDVLLILSPGPQLPLRDDTKVVLPGSPDLSAEAQVRVEAGRVRQVRISVEPNTLYIGGLSQGQVRVRLLDSEGNAIVDPTMRIIPEAGQVGPISMEPDGTHTARFSPPQGLEPGRVEVQVEGTSEPYSGATEVRLAPRQSELLVSSRGAMVTNLSPEGFTVPMGAVTMLAHLPGTDLPLYGLGGVSFHRISRSFDRTRTINGQEVENYIRSLQTNVIGFYLGGAYRAPLGRLIGQGSLSLVGGAVPYATDYWDDSEGYLWQIDGSIGIRAGLGLELGVGPGGIAFEFAFTQLGLDADGGESGNVGGLTLELGYVIPLR